MSRTTTSTRPSRSSTMTTDVTALTLAPALAEIPRQVIDPRTQAPAWGSYRGAFRRTELASLVRDPLERLATEKRWVWGAVATERALVAWAIVDLGYASSAFAFAWDRERGMIVDRSMMGVPRLCRVRQSASARIDARFVHPRGSLRMRARDGDPAIEVAIELRELALHATLEERGAPPSLTAVAPVPGGVVSTTEKRALMPVRGSALIAGRRVSLDDAVGGYDLTHGLLARRTRWNWAFLMGRARPSRPGQCGEPVALNLVQGFVGAPECAVWIGGEPVLVAEGRFDFAPDAPEGPWRVRSADGAVDLAFAPGGVHAEHRDLGLVRARFVQPVGTFDGTIQVAGRTLVLDRVPGVVEDQDVVW